MKTRNELLVVLMLFLSCGNRSNPKQLVPDTSKKNITGISRKSKDLINPIIYRQCVRLSDSLFQLNDSFKKKALIELFSEDFENIPPEMILSIKRDSISLNVADYGKCISYEINLSDNLPSVMAKKMILLFNEKRETGVLLQLFQLTPIKIRISDSSILLAGTYLVRAKGYFAIYRFNKVNGFDIIFNSLSDANCGNGLPVYNSSLDCISYDPFLLRIVNVDDNKDGLCDLIFIGQANFYCSGLETGYGRKDRKPLRKEDLHIRFKTQELRDSLYWTLIDTAACSKLSQ